MASGARVNVYNNTIYNSTDQGIFSQVFPKQPRVTLRNNIVHTSRAGACPDMSISRPFDEAYFCTGVGAGPNFDPSGCGANIAAALANETTNQPLPFTGVNTACLYLGSNQPFRGVGVSVVAPPSGSGADLQWDYWNGRELGEPGDGDVRGLQLPVGRVRLLGGRSRGLGHEIRGRRWPPLLRARLPVRDRLLTHGEADHARRREHGEPLQPDPGPTGLLNSLWQGVGVTGLQDPGSQPPCSSTPPPTSTSRRAAWPGNGPRLPPAGRRLAGLWADRTLLLRHRLPGSTDRRRGLVPGQQRELLGRRRGRVHGTTAVELLSFEALPADSAVDLSWRTGSELRNLGFHLHRSLSKNGPWTRITPSLIPGLGSSPEGASYSFRDTGLTNGVRYFYRLEDIDSESGSTFHGPVSAVPGTAPPAEEEDGGAFRPPIRRRPLKTRIRLRAALSMGSPEPTAAPRPPPSASSPARSEPWSWSYGPPASSPPRPPPG